jgi:hypothetical protein
MRRVILLLPNPDLLQLANCHKYVTRSDDKAYSDIYTTNTVRGACKDVDKMLVIGHGKVGGFEGITIDEVANAIIESGISLTGGKKIAFDTCYAGSRGDAGNLPSALHLLRVRLKKRHFDCDLELTGAIGPTVTIGNVGDKRLVVDPAKLPRAGKLQGKKMTAHKVDFFQHRGDWQEGAPSSQIKTWAHEEHTKLIKFAVDFRGALTGELDQGPGRKVTMQV